MDFGLGTYVLAYLAGALSTLSPCALPLLPIMIASAIAQHRFGPLALAAGLTLSFAVVGLFVAMLGSIIGLNAGVLRQGAALLLIGFGVLLTSTRGQVRFASAMSRLSRLGDGLFARITGTGWRGQFALGLALGIVWSPCVGPTLGAASALATQGRELPRIVLLMLVFGLGAATPLVLIGSLSREVLQRARGRLLAAGQHGRWLLGMLMVLIGLAILTGWDKDWETWVVDHSPNWLIELSTRY